MFTLTEMVAAVVANCPDLDSFEKVCDALKTGRLAPFFEAEGKTLNQAAAMLWTGVQNARRPN